MTPSKEAYFLLKTLVFGGISLRVKGSGKLQVKGKLQEDMKQAIRHHNEEIKRLVKEGAHTRLIN